MPIWDLRCVVCGKTYPDMAFKNADERDGWLRHLVCDHPCHGRLTIAPAAGSFVVTGFAAKNGYSQ